MKKAILLLLLSFISIALFGQLIPKPVGSVQATNQFFVVPGTGNVYHYLGPSYLPNAYYKVPTTTYIDSVVSATGVKTFNGRSGVVVPQESDYSSFYYSLSNPSGYLNSVAADGLYVMRTAGNSNDFNSLPAGSRVATGTVNTPDGSASQLILNIDHAEDPTNTAIQFGGRFNAYFRNKQAGVWQSWKRMWTSADKIPKTSIDTTDANGVLPKSGVLPYLKPRTLYVSGDMTINGSTGGNADLRIKRNDINVMFLRSTPSNDFEFQTRNSTDGTLKELVGQINYNTGNWFVKSITTNSIAKVGGLSNQFLMADGSVNSNSYALTPTGATTSAATYNVISTNELNVFTGTTSTWTLPVITGNTWKRLHIKNRGSGTLTINANGGTNTIYTTSAVSTFSLAAGESAVLFNDGTYWNKQ